MALPVAWNASWHLNDQMNLFIMIHIFYIYPKVTDGCKNGGWLERGIKS